MRRLSMPRAQRPCRPTPSRAWLGLVVLVLLDPGCSGSAGADKDAAADLTADADKDEAADLTADAGPEIEVTPDAGPDLVPEVADAVAEVPAPTGQAWAFLQDPTENDGKPTKVVLPWVSAPDGTLTGPYAKVYNCLKQPGGVRVTFDYEGMDL